MSYSIACNVLGSGFAEFVKRSDLDNFETDTQGGDLYECVDWDEINHSDLVGPTTLDFNECTDFS